MYRFLLICCLLVGHYIWLNAQMIIPDGIELVLDGAVQVVIEDLAYAQEGELTPGNAEFIFRGGTSRLSPGLVRTPSFYRITLDQQAGALLQLVDGGIAIEDELFFMGGSLDLNGQEVDLGQTGRLIGESETNRALNGGGLTARIHATRTLNAPSLANPANLGLIISSGANLGVTEVSRYFEAQSVGAATSIERSYRIAPTNNANLNATLRATYWDAELNGVSEIEIEAFMSPNGGGNFVPLAFVSRDAAANYVEFAGLNSFPSNNSITLADFSQTAFPVSWLGFEATPIGNSVLCEWQTGDERNNDYFVLERSEDGASFQPIGQTPGTGNSQEIHTYQAWDNQPIAGRSWYRVSQVDLDGKQSYSNVREVFFSPSIRATLQPNPASTFSTLDLLLEKEAPILLSVMDQQGRVVFRETQEVPVGKSQIQISVEGLSQGIYIVQLTQSQQSLRLPLVVIR